MAITELNQYRLLLTKIYNGDYAHAGDIEAIEIVLAKVLEFNPTIKENKALDVGSGFGGTAGYIYKKGFKEIYGIDVDSAAVAYSKNHHPAIHFSTTDALKADTVFHSIFGFIYLFNVAYAIKDKETLIKNLTNVAAKNCILVLFDYALHTGKTLHLCDLSGKPMHFIDTTLMTQILLKNEWTVLSVEDTTPKYIIWYKKLLQNLYTKRSALLSEFSEEAVSTVQYVFESLLRSITEGALNATIIYAKHI